MTAAQIVGACLIVATLAIILVLRSSGGSDIRSQLETIISNQGRQMAAIDDIGKAQAAEKNGSRGAGRVNHPTAHSVC